jgi:hypothetical protein
MPGTKNTRTRFEGAEPILNVKDMASVRPDQPFAVAEYPSA